MKVHDGPMKANIGFWETLPWGDTRGIDGTLTQHNERQMQLFMVPKAILMCTYDIECTKNFVGT